MLLENWKSSSWCQPITPPHTEAAMCIGPSHTDLFCTLSGPAKSGYTAYWTMISQASPMLHTLLPRVACGTHVGAWDCPWGNVALRLKKDLQPHYWPLAQFRHLASPTWLSTGLLTGSWLWKAITWKHWLSEYKTYICSCHNLDESKGSSGITWIVTATWKWFHIEVPSYFVDAVASTCWASNMCCCCCFLKVII